MTIKLTTLIVVDRSSIVKPNRSIAAAVCSRPINDSAIYDRIRARMDSSFGVLDF